MNPNRLFFCFAFFAAAISLEAKTSMTYKSSPLFEEKANFIVEDLSRSGIQYLGLKTKEGGATYESMNGVLDQEEFAPSVASVACLATECVSGCVGTGCYSCTPSGMSLCT